MHATFKSKVTLNIILFYSYKTEIIQTEEEYIKIIKNCTKDDKFFIKECAVNDFAKHFKIMFNKPKDLQLSKAIVIKYDET